MIVEKFSHFAPRNVEAARLKVGALRFSTFFHGKKGHFSNHYMSMPCSSLT